MSSSIKTGYWLAMFVVITACRSSDQNGSKPIGLVGSVESTYLGCVQVSPDRPGEIMLWLIDDPAMPGGSRRPQAIDQSTSAQGPWIGTRQLVLSGPMASRLAEHAGERVVITGTLEAEVGTVGREDQLQQASGVAFRRLRVSAVEPVPGPCAFDPRLQEPGAPDDDARR